MAEFPNRLHIYQRNGEFQILSERPGWDDIGAADVLEHGEPLATYELASQGTLRVQRNYLVKVKTLKLPRIKVPR